MANWYSARASGDLGGAKIAFLAYEKSLEAQTRALPISTVLPPEQQILFIAWGQWRGDAIRIEEQRVMMQSPIRIRLGNIG